MSQENDELRQQLADVSHERDTLAAEVTRLRNLDYAQILADAAAQKLADAEAENYTGSVFTALVGDDERAFEILVTTQRVGANSPGERAAELEVTVRQQSVAIAALDYGLRTIATAKGRNTVLGFKQIAKQTLNKVAGLTAAFDEAKS